MTTFSTPTPAMAARRFCRWLLLCQCLLALELAPTVVHGMSRRSIMQKMQQNIAEESGVFDDWLKNAEASFLSEPAGRSCESGLNRPSLRRENGKIVWEPVFSVSTASVDPTYARRRRFSFHSFEDATSPVEPIFDCPTPRGMTASTPNLSYASDLSPFSTSSSSSTSVSPPNEEILEEQDEGICLSVAEEPPSQESRMISDRTQEIFMAVQRLKDTGRFSARRWGDKNDQDTVTPFLYLYQIIKLHPAGRDTALYYFLNMCEEKNVSMVNLDPDTWSVFQSHLGGLDEMWPEVLLPRFFAISREVDSARTTLSAWLKAVFTYGFSHVLETLLPHAVTYNAIWHEKLASTLQTTVRSADRHIGLLQWCRTQNASHLFKPYFTRIAHIYAQEKKWTFYIKMLQELGGDRFRPLPAIINAVRGNASTSTLNAMLLIYSPTAGTQLGKMPSVRDFVPLLRTFIETDLQTKPSLHKFLTWSFNQPLKDIADYKDILSHALLMGKVDVHAALMEAKTNRRLARFTAQWFDLPMFVMREAVNIRDAADAAIPTLKTHLLSTLRLLGDFAEVIGYDPEMKYLMLGVTIQQMDVELTQAVLHAQTVPIGTAHRGIPRLLYLIANRFVHRPTFMAVVEDPHMQRYLDTTDSPLTKQVKRLAVLPEEQWSTFYNRNLTDEYLPRSSLFASHLKRSVLRMSDSRLSSDGTDGFQLEIERRMPRTKSSVLSKQLEESKRAEGS